MENGFLCKLKYCCQENANKLQNLLKMLKLLDDIIQQETINVDPHVL